MTDKRRFLRRRRSGGFSLIEALIGIAVIGIAMLGLAQVFLLSIANNTRAGEISNASLLAQLRLDYLRTLTTQELNSFPSTVRGESADESLDPNVDGTPDFRRITIVTPNATVYAVKVLVFPAAKIGVAQSTLIAAPFQHRVRAVLNTVIIR